MIKMAIILNFFNFNYFLLKNYIYVVRINN